MACRATSILSLFRNKFNKFNNTGVLNVRFYLSYDIKIILKSYFWWENVRVLPLWVTLKVSFHNISRKSVNH